jgi:glycerate-2-kinase
VIGFGKGSAGNAQYLEKLIEPYITEGYVIDTTPVDLKKIKFSPGSHPLPSTENFNFTDNLVKRIGELKLTETDLVLVIICGGGSAMLVHPSSLTLEQKIDVNKALLKSGANITEMNIVRKHLSTVKGGGLAKLLFPAQVATLIFSDVPGNDLSVIASGPTVKDTSTLENVKEVMNKFNLLNLLPFLNENVFHETPKEDQYFANVSNILVLSNITALEAMKKVAEEKKISVRIHSDKFQANASDAGKILLNNTHQNEMLLAGGETTVIVKGTGVGGRNQEVVLAALSQLTGESVIVSIASDGWDNSANAGAIGDTKTIQDAARLQLDVQKFLNNNNSFPFFESTRDGIKTGRLPSNVSDLFLVWKK